MTLSLRRSPTTALDSILFLSADDRTEKENDRESSAHLRNQLAHYTFVSFVARGPFLITVWGARSGPSLTTGLGNRSARFPSGFHKDPQEDAYPSHREPPDPEQGQQKLASRGRTLLVAANGRRDPEYPRILGHVDDLWLGSRRPGLSGLPWSDLAVDDVVSLGRCPRPDRAVPVNELTGDFSPAVARVEVASAPGLGHAQNRAFGRDPVLLQQGLLIVIAAHQVAIDEEPGQHHGQDHGGEHHRVLQTAGKHAGRLTSAHEVGADRTGDRQERGQCSQLIEEECF
jgi:hypothetical protein